MEELERIILAYEKFTADHVFAKNGIVTARFGNKTLSMKIDHYDLTEDGFSYTGSLFINGTKSATVHNCGYGGDSNVTYLPSCVKVLQELNAEIVQSAADTGIDSSINMICDDIAAEMINLSMN